MQGAAIILIPALGPPTALGSFAPLSPDNPNTYRPLCFTELNSLANFYLMLCKIKQVCFCEMPQGRLVFPKVSAAVYLKLKNIILLFQWDFDFDVIYWWKDNDYLD